MRSTALLLMLAVAVLYGCQAVQRRALFYPTHHGQTNGLEPWMHEGAVIGYARLVSDPQVVWLLLHGNGGQAADRAYALPVFAARDAVFVMEYPGYGARPGKPSRRAFDAAALQAYQLLRAQFPGVPVCIVAESIGSGPAAVLASAAPPPDKLVFIVPFDNLKSVAAEHVRYLPVGWLLAGSWDNVGSLTDYRGPVEVFGAQRDEVIPLHHARALAASLPQAKFHVIPGGHNEWSQQGEVRVRYP